jgi:hypothetical protein
MIMSFGIPHRPDSDVFFSSEGIPTLLILHFPVIASTAATNLPFSCLIEPRHFHDA